MTYKFSKEEKDGLMNLVKLVIIICLAFLIFLGFKNFPDTKTANGIFSYWLLIGCVLSIFPFWFSFVRSTEKARLNWFFLAAGILVTCLFTGLYLHITF
jgi:hypothetical protein